MAGPVNVAQVLVRLGSGVFVADKQSDRGTERLALEQARQHLDLIGLVALGHEPALARTAPIEVALDIFDDEGQTRRAAVDDHADTPAMGLTKRGDPEHLAKRTTRHCYSRLEPPFSRHPPPETGLDFKW